MNEWYQNLIKPPFTPPPAYFPVAWGILYALMTVAFFILISKPHSHDKYVAVNLFIFQLVFNFTWSYVFFEMKSVLLGLLDVLILFVLLVFTVVYFYKVSKLASILLIPYLLQVIFAIYLNAGILFLN